METNKNDESDPKQCKCEEERLLNNGCESIDLETDDQLKENVDICDSVVENTTNYEPELIFVSQEEPIDLTFSKPLKEKNDDTEVPIQMNNQEEYQLTQTPNYSNYVPSSSLNERGCKRKLEYSNGEILITNWQQPVQSQPYYTPVDPPLPQCYSTVPDTSRQQDILKMAKQVFSKRTRTLYHWMYPSASKHQIKQVVSTTWDSMSAQEKNIYVAQVLGRFGYNNAGLMVNPQLGQIRELPPLPGIQEFNTKASELQNAISSITNESGNSQVLMNCGPSAKMVKRGRPAKKKVDSEFVETAQEFDDDPELSKELAQFSILFKNRI